VKENRSVQRSSIGFGLALVLGAAVALIATGVARAAPVASVVDLGTLGGNYSRALAVSDSGFVVGQSRIAGNARQHAFRWAADSGIQDLGSFGGDSYPHAVNNSGAVAGYSHRLGDRGETARSTGRPKPA
jgi:probable HAF family extracellular repeat protein